MAVLLYMLMFTATVWGQSVTKDELIYNSEEGNTYASVGRETRGITSANILPSITINGKILPVKVIKDRAFSNCTHLTSVTIPNSVTTIKNDAFSDCDELTTLTIPNSVTTICNRAFYNCIKLTSLIIPNSVTTIEDKAFAYCRGLLSVTIPTSITTIGNRVFSSCEGLTTLIIPNSVTTIGDYAFFDCSGLTSVTIPNSVTTICDRAFSDCVRLTSVTIPNSVTTIQTMAFDKCRGITSFTVMPENPNYCDISGVLFNKAATILIAYPIGRLSTSYTIPNSVITIGYNAFSGCPKLTSVIIPNTVTTIEDNAFASCEGLTTFAIPNLVTTIKDYTFFNCKGITSITIPNTIKKVGGLAFYGCSGLTSINSFATTPPVAGRDAFRLITTSIPVYVPKGSLTSYKSAAEWSKFSNIIETDFVGIEESIADTGNLISFTGSKITISATVNGKLVEIYNASGHLVRSTSTTDETTIIDISDLPEGIYIVKAGENTQKFIKR
ncbi:MAG: leucine-rich repeat domain-containing protein [Bacteroidales bacterium]